MRDLGTLAGGSSDAWAVSGNIVVGDSQTPTQIHAFAYDLGAANPTMRDLGTLGGGIDSDAAAVSGKIVVGSSSTEPAGGCKGMPGTGPPRGCNSHAFAYDLGAAAPAMRDLGTLGGSGTSGAGAVSGNIIVGSASPALGSWQEYSLEAHGFYYDLGVAAPEMRVLGDLEGASSQGSGRVYTIARAVSGNIVVGKATTPDGANHAVAWKLAH
jgi:uncharacterized membrane protein